jgi:hypothetical protein
MQKTSLAVARAWLYQRLSDGKAHQATHLGHLAEQEGISPATLMTAKRYLNAKSALIYGRKQPSVTVWYLGHGKPRNSPQIHGKPCLNIRKGLTRLADQRVLLGYQHDQDVYRYGGLFWAASTPGKDEASTPGNASAPLCIDCQAAPRLEDSARCAACQQLADDHWAQFQATHPDVEV